MLTVVVIREFWGFGLGLGMDLGTGLGLPVEKEEADLCILVEQTEGLFNSLFAGECRERMSLFSSGRRLSSGLLGSTVPPLSFLHFIEKEEALTNPFGLAGGLLTSCMGAVWVVPLGRGEGVPLTGRAPNFGSLDTMGDLLRIFCSISK